ncbi:uncharacterized protein [Elaeis guineensis]|uniref:protein OBERON 1 n=1 Tax=Elaeis guineensis var. tenera TaxID=51953 RepID=A0A6I9QZ47_ELAGV|nr:protein OBERON 1 [Elaeis guineensis]XP_010917748.1 protein OBERON 1 [Elaeis guineensis]XP_010917749.1 protein OBERON 1 [Elaeis guineensis]XP_010917750.1 protein OBERON 1 [Elaeis guineensis]XP_029119555.1 protein OBERON 1 [Elaeis guineensis]
MEGDLSEGSNCQTPSSNGKLLVAIPVAGGSSGEGLPYAPEDWPHPGDKWRWKVGNRKTASGHWIDRYLYPPAHLPKATGNKSGFPSKSSLEEYIRKEFPDKDVDSFFASFIWRVPCAGHAPRKGSEKNLYIHASPNSVDVSECYGSVSEIRVGGCKAGNKMCKLQEKERSNGLRAKDCNICCSEYGFCRDCCCILCCKTVDWAYGAYSFIRCEAIVDENLICGHVAHIECALRSYMGGTVGGAIDLDVEYYCRRCDNKTDLISHVTKLITICESLDSRDDIEKILNLGFCILRGSQQMGAKSLHNQIGLILLKLKQGVPLGEIWKMEDSISMPTVGDTSHLGNEITLLGAPDITRYKINEGLKEEVELLQKNDVVDGRAQLSVYITSDYDNVSVKLEDDIDNILRELKSSQELDCRIVEQKLYDQKDYLLSLYRQLDSERSALANPISILPNGGDCDNLLANVLDRVDQIRHEEEKLRNIMKIAKGLGETNKSILHEHFGLASDN